MNLIFKSCYVLLSTPYIYLKKPPLLDTYTVRSLLSLVDSLLPRYVRPSWNIDGNKNEHWLPSISIKFGKDERTDGFFPFFPHSGEGEEVVLLFFNCCLSFHWQLDCRLQTLKIVIKHLNSCDKFVYAGQIFVTFSNDIQKMYTTILNIYN